MSRATAPRSLPQPRLGSQQRGLRGSHVPSADAAGKARRAPAPGSPLLGGAPAGCPLRCPQGGRAGRAGAGAHAQAFLLPSGSSSGDGHRRLGGSFGRASGWVGGLHPGGDRAPPEPPRSRSEGRSQSPPGIPLLPRAIPRERWGSGRRRRRAPSPAGPEVCSSGTPTGVPPQGEPPPAPGKGAHVGRARPRAPRAHLRHPYTSRHVCAHISSHSYE